MISLTIPVAGKQLPLSTIAPLANAIFPKIEAGVKAGKPDAEIAAGIKAALPDALIELSESLLNIFFPGAGTLEEVIVWIIRNVGDGDVDPAVIFKNSELKPTDDRFGIGDE